MSVVIDANLLVSLVTDEARGQAVSAKLDEWATDEEALHAPELARYEIANALTGLVSAGATTTRTGLDVYARLDDGSYPKDIKVSDAELAAVNLEEHNFHPEWNYAINPRVDA